MKNTLPKFFGQALFLCLSITLSLIAAEFVLSVLARHNPKIAFLTEDRSNPENIEDFITFDQLQRKNYFLLKPGEYFGGFIANSKGFVTQEHSYKKRTQYSELY